MSGLKTTMLLAALVGGVMSTNEAKLGSWFGDAPQGQSRQSQKENGRTLVYTDAILGTIGFIDISNPSSPQPLGTRRSRRLEWRNLVLRAGPALEALQLIRQNVPEQVT